eukprot:6058204-Pleurochrysis_carterae.AAC.4
MLAQLEERGLVEQNLGEAVGNLVARANDVRLDRAVELALAEYRGGSTPSACSAQSSSMRQSGQLVQPLQNCP